MIDEAIDNICGFTDTGERKQQITKSEVERIYNEIYKMQGNFKSDGDPENGEKFWEEVNKQ